MKHTFLHFYDKNDLVLKFSYLASASSNCFAREQTLKIKSLIERKAYDRWFILDITYGSIFKHLVRNSKIDPRKEMFKTTYYQQLVSSICQSKIS